MEDEKKEKEIEVYSPAKAAFIMLKTNLQFRIGDENRNSIVFCFSDTLPVRQALQDFLADELIPAKTFTDLTQSLKQQMFAKKKYGKGHHE